MNTYAFDQGWQKERDRLAGIESLFDSYSTRRLADVGVSEGWQCLEVGFGAGGVALWLAERVGSTGRVVAVDLDPRFLDGHGRANLEVRKHDVAADPLEEAAFDLAHARAVLDLSLTGSAHWSGCSRLSARAAGWCWKKSTSAGS